MSGQLLEPRLLLRAARLHRVALSKGEASQLAALLCTSWGVTLFGPVGPGRLLAGAIVDAARQARVCSGVLALDAGTAVSEVREAIRLGNWLVVETFDADGVLREVETMLESQATKPRSGWRVILIHEPAPHKRFPQPPDLMRHFPLFEVVA
jgi:hypothetical protein